MENIPMWLHFVFASAATCGFAIFFNVNKKILLYDSIIGGVGWLIYLYLYYNIDNPMLWGFISAASVSIISEALARKIKQPAIIFVTPGILPLIPGIGLYNTVHYIIQKKYLSAATTGTSAIMIGIGIALGILVSSSIFKVFNLYKLKKAFINKDAARYVDWVNLGKNRTNNLFILNRKEMNEHLNSLDLDISQNEKEKIEKMERTSTEDFVVDNYDIEKSDEYTLDENTITDGKLTKKNNSSTDKNKSIGKK